MGIVHLVLHRVTMRKLILIGILFKVQISLAVREGDPTQSCFNGKGCLSDSQCGENGICQFPEMTLSGKPSVGFCYCEDTKEYNEDSEDSYETDSYVDSDQNYDSAEDHDLESDEYYSLEDDKDYNRGSKHNDLMNMDLKINIPNLPSLLALLQSNYMKKKPEPKGCKPKKKCKTDKNCQYPGGYGGKCVKRKCKCKCPHTNGRPCKRDKHCGGDATCIPKMFCSSGNRFDILEDIGMIDRKLKSVCCCLKKCKEDVKCKNDGDCGKGGWCEDRNKECPWTPFLGEDGNLQSLLSNEILPNPIQSIKMNEETPLNLLEDKKGKKRCCCL